MKDTVFTYISYIDAAPTKVWDALVSKTGIWNAWYGAWIKSSFKPGDKLEFVGPGVDGEETVHIYGEVIAFDIGKTFTYIEHPGASYKPDHAKLQTRINWNFEAAGDCTKLTLIVDQWSEGHYAQASAFNDWSTVISIFKSFVETGKILQLA